VPRNETRRVKMTRGHGNSLWGRPTNSDLGPLTVGVEMHKNHYMGAETSLKIFNHPLDVLVA